MLIIRNACKMSMFLGNISYAPGQYCVSVYPSFFSPTIKIWRAKLVCIYFHKHARYTIPEIQFYFRKPPRPCTRSCPRWDDPDGGQWWSLGKRRSPLASPVGRWCEQESNGRSPMDPDEIPRTRRCPMQRLPWNRAIHNTTRSGIIFTNSSKNCNRECLIQEATHHEISSVNQWCGGHRHHSTTRALSRRFTGPPLQVEIPPPVQVTLPPESSQSRSPLRHWEMVWQDHHLRVQRIIRRWSPPNPWKSGTRSFAGRWPPSQRTTEPGKD